MALNENSSFRLEDRIKKPIKREHVYEHEHVHVEQSTGDFIKPEQKEKKDKNLHLLTYSSLIDRVDAYATKIGVKRVAVIEAAITDYLNRAEQEE